jgi:MFS family permease
MTIWQALRDWVFWVTTLSAFIGLFVFNGMLPHVFPALMGRGFSQTTLVELQLPAILLASVGALIGGWAADRFQTAKIAVPICIIAAVGSYFMLIVTPQMGGVWLLGTAMIVGALTFTALFPMGQYFATRFFGLKSLAEIIGVQFMFTNVVAGLGAPLFGWIFDSTKSYDLMFIIAIVMHLAQGAVFLILPKYRYAKNIGEMPAADAAAATVAGEMIGVGAVSAAEAVTKSH